MGHNGGRPAGPGDGVAVVQDAVRIEAKEAERLSADHLDDLAEQAARGSRLAFERIYVVLIDDLYGYARSHVNDDTAAEDVVATVFMKAWQYARSYRRGSQSYRRWVFGIARNEVRNHWRATQSSRQLERELEMQRPDDGSAPEVAIDEAALAEALSRLTPEQRDVIVLRYFNGKSHREIAELLDKAEGSIRALQHRALRQLRKAVARASS